MQKRTEEQIANYTDAVEKYLDTCFIWPSLPQQQLFAAMRYSLLAGGKRLRPIYVLEFCRLCGDTSSGADFLAAVAPDYAVISVGANNDYGHPSAPVLQRLQSEGANVYRTDLLGTICCKSDGQTVTVSFEKTANETAAQQTQTQGDYIGNVNSKKFHLPSCSGLPETQNQIHFATRQAAVQAGYTPCARCKP